MRAQLHRNLVHFASLSNGETYAYRQAGEASSKPLLMIHGAFSSSSAFSHFFPQLSDTFRVIAPDLRGHGQSSWITPQESHDDHVEDLKLFCDELGLEKISLLGWSAGGAVTMKFAARYPELVDKLVLHGSIGAQGYPYYIPDENGKPTKSRITSWEEWSQHHQPKYFKSLTANRDIEKIHSLIMKTFCGRNQPSDEFLKNATDDWFACRCYHLAGYWVNKFNITNEDNGASKGTNEISRIKCPVLLLHGERDMLVKLEEAKKTKALIGDNAVLKTFPEGGHAIMTDYPEEFLENLKRFC